MTKTDDNSENDQNHKLSPKDSNFVFQEGIEHTSENTKAENIPRCSSLNNLTKHPKIDIREQRLNLNKHVTASPEKKHKMYDKKNISMKKNIKF